jgi:hypothetical protein
MDPFPLRRLKLHNSDSAPTIFGQKGDAAAHYNNALPEKLLAGEKNNVKS